MSSGKAEADDAMSSGKAEAADEAYDADEAYAADDAMSSGKAEADDAKGIPADIADRLNDTDAHSILFTLPAPERLAHTVKFAYYADRCTYAKFADNAIDFEKLDSDLPQARDHLGVSHQTIMTAHRSNIHTDYAFIAEFAEYAVYATYCDVAQTACEYWEEDSPY